jgi:multiple sugar transport system substrate-binding protein
MPMVMRPARIILASALAGAVGYWLFADTARHYWPQQRDPNRIRFAHFGSYQDYAVWAQVIAAFTEQHPHLSVEQEYVSGWYGRYDAKLRQQALAGALPQVALVQPASFLAMSDQFADLDLLLGGASAGSLAADLDGLAFFQIDGRQRALPVSGGNLLIYCNPHCITRAESHRQRPIARPHPDWTMADFAALARDLTCDFDGDSRLDQFGFWQPRWVYYLPFIWSFGADIMDSARPQWRLRGPPAQAALEFYQAMRVDPHRYAPHPEEISQLIQDVGFLTGKTAMCVNGPWFQPFLAETDFADDYLVLPIPRGPGGRFTRMTWDGIALAEGLSPAETASAAAFIRFVCQPHAQRILARTQRALPANRQARAAFDRDGRDPRAARFVAALDYARPQPRHPAFARIDRIVNRHLRALVSQPADHSPADCLDRIAAEVDALLGKIEQQH